MAPRLSIGRHGADQRLANVWQCFGLRPKAILLPELCRFLSLEPAQLDLWEYHTSSHVGHIIGLERQTLRSLQPLALENASDLHIGILLGKLYRGNFRPFWQGLDGSRILVCQRFLDLARLPPFVQHRSSPASASVLKTSSQTARHNTLPRNGYWSSSSLKRAIGPGICGMTPGVLQVVVLPLLAPKGRQ